VRLPSKPVPVQSHPAVCGQAAAGSAPAPYINTDFVHKITMLLQVLVSMRAHNTWAATPPKSRTGACRLCPKSATSANAPNWAAAWLKATLFMCSTELLCTMALKCSLAITHLWSAAQIRPGSTSMMIQRMGVDAHEMDVVLQCDGKQIPAVDGFTSTYMTGKPCALCYVLKFVSHRCSSVLFDDCLVKCMAAAADASPPESVSIDSISLCFKLPPLFAHEQDRSRSMARLCSRFLAHLESAIVGHVWPQVG